MTTILIGECKQEVSTFNPVASTYADFDVNFGAEVLDYHRGRGTEIGGALHVFDGYDDGTPGGARRGLSAARLAAAAAPPG
jgi:microcystin degradation protein MlrC